jgi:hypothetical protein
VQRLRDSRVLSTDGNPVDTRGYKNLSRGINCNILMFVYVGNLAGYGVTWGGALGVFVSWFSLLVLLPYSVGGGGSIVGGDYSGSCND